MSVRAEELALSAVQTCAAIAASGVSFMAVDEQIII